MILGRYAIPIDGLNGEYLDHLFTHLPNVNHHCHRYTYVARCCCRSYEKET